MALGHTLPVLLSYLGTVTHPHVGQRFPRLSGKTYRLPEERVPPFVGTVFDGRTP
jgi:hypothetical protein